MSGIERAQERVKKRCTACILWKEQERLDDRGRERERQRKKERDNK